MVSIFLDLAQMTTQGRIDIRNIAIIAHVDHGKTTLVDALLKQSRVFRDNQEVGELIMDSNPLERERGITILAKNTAVFFDGVKINIIDTPGHADFSGEVERILNMADGCLLLVDAVDGPMPQTRYVLRKALLRGLKPIVVINKIDRDGARIDEVKEAIQDLFLDVVTEAEQLDYPVVHTSAREGYSNREGGDSAADMGPLFRTIIDEVPPFSGAPEGPFQLQVASLDYDNHLGTIAIGRVNRGIIDRGSVVLRINREGNHAESKVDRLYVFQNLDRVPVSSAGPGEIIAIAGIEEVSIGDTITDPLNADPLPPIALDEPTLTITVGINTSPFAGKEGAAITARQLQARLYRELQTNVSLRVEPTDSPGEFTVIGRGELHLGILLETIRREGSEIQASRPQAVTKILDGKKLEPFEYLFLDTGEEYIGSLTESLAKRLARMEDMRADGSGHVHMKFKIPTRGLIGFHSFFQRTVRGNGVMNTEFIGYEQIIGEMQTMRTGALVASQDGLAVAFGLGNAQDRGITFIPPQTYVYEGMIVGVHQRENDMAINVCKEKKQTNIRASSADIAVRLTPPTLFSLEESLEFITANELVEITPLSIRMRKKTLGTDSRRREERNENKAR